jgi:hypothetical protein
MRQRPSIFSVAAMVAGGDDGLPWRQAGRQWRFAAHFDCYLICSMVHECFCHLRTPAGKIYANFDMPPHRTPCALCGSIEKNMDSLVKGMILFDQGGRGRGGGGEGRGGKVMVGKRSPPSVRGPFVFCCCLREGFFLIFSRAQKYWRENHLLDPLSLSVLLPPPTPFFLMPSPLPLSLLSGCVRCAGRSGSTSRTTTTCYGTATAAALATAEGMEEEECDGCDGANP